jgi:hypothetical protein
MQAITRGLTRLVLGGVLLLPLACAPAPIATHEGGIYLGASPSERLDKAVASVAAVELSFEGAEQLSRYKGTVFVDNPATLGGLPPERTVVSFLQDPAIRAVLEGADEQAAAKLLSERGGRLLLLHARAAPSVDRGGSVLARLYHHDRLEYFKLMRVGEGLYYYKAVEKEVTFPAQLADLCLRYLRHRLSGGPPVQLPKIEPEDGTWTFAAALRGQGQELASAFGQDDDLRKALDELVVDLEKAHRRKVEPLGFPPLVEHLGSLRIDLVRVSERTIIEPRDERTLEAVFELGIDGAYMMSPGRKERATLMGGASFTRSINRVDAFLQATARLGEMSDRRPWRDDKAWLEAFRGHHFRETGSGGISALYRGVPAIPMEAVSVEAVRLGVVRAGDWYMRNLGPNGEVVYKFWPSENRYANEYNHVRHALATWNLVQAWQMDPSRTDFLEGARRALGFTDRFLVREKDPKSGLMMAYHSFENVQKLGSVVVSLLGMIDLARATGSHEWDEQMKEMGRFVLFMQEEDGRMRPYYVPKGHPYETQENDIVPGEAALALVYLADYFDDNSWIAGLPKYWEYYEPWWRERAKQRRADRPWPAEIYENEVRLDLVEIGPWTVMAANAYHRRTGDEKSAAFALDVARWMVESYQWTEANAPFPDYIGGYYKLPGELPAMQAFCYAEGTAAAYALAQRFRPEDVPFFEAATRRSMRLALQMQYDDLSTYAFSRPDQVDGGIRYALNETKVRVDYVHHALSAMYQYVLATRTDSNLAVSVKDGPALPQQRMMIERKARAEAAVAAGDLETAKSLGPALPKRAVVPTVPLRGSDRLRFEGKPAPNPMAPVEGKSGEERVELGEESEADERE